MIPKQFKLLNHTWRVEMVPGLLEHEDGPANGTCDPATHIITLNSLCEPEQLWHTWLHELLHAILHTLGRYDQNDDEGFVDSVAGALAQVYPSPYEQFALTLGK
jgi:Zn-dependent peptidase ImmA (M78 family)